MWTWKADTPARVPAGARISAGKSGRVAVSLPNSELTEVNWVPVSCIPSPESPAKRMTTRSSSVVWWRVAVDTFGPLSRDRPPPTVHLVRGARAPTLRAEHTAVTDPLRELVPATRPVSGRKSGALEADSPRPEPVMRVRRW